MTAYRTARRGGFGLLAALTLSVMLLTPAAAFTPDTEASVGSPPTPFSQNKQNEPALSIHPLNPDILVSGANDNIDLEACNAGADNTCPFTPGVGVTGVYFSLDGGDTWIQPTYTGYSARNCLGAPGPDAECVPDPNGPIGTLPWYYETNRMVSNGDPIAVFGPRPDTNGNFSWANGARLYFSNIATKFSRPSSQEAFKGSGAIAVSRTDDVVTAAAGGVAGKNAWMPPVVASKQNAALFSDKEEMWADNAATSDFFGNVYVCYAKFVGLGAGPIVVSRSTDGGDTWSSRQVSPAAWGAGPGRSGGRQGCTLRTDSEGTLYVFWTGYYDNALWMTRSYDGGAKFEVPRKVARAVPSGAFDPVQRRLTLDGVAGARSSRSFPTVSIANGAPTGAGAPDTLVLAWSDGRDGLNNEKVLMQRSTDGGDTWSTPITVSRAGDRPTYPSVAISPDGTDVYLVYTNYLDPWRSNLSDTRRSQAVVRHADGNLGGWSDLHVGAVGDARGSSANALSTGFMGDYNYAAATNDFGGTTWIDVRDATVCPAVNAYRQSLVDGAPIARPAPQLDCPATFGNTDIFAGTYADPTP